MNTVEKDISCRCSSEAELPSEWVELGVQVGSRSTGLLVRVQVWSKRKLHACCF